jgi:hypothetical protein
MILAHVGAVPVEELLAPAAGTFWVALRVRWSERGRAMSFSRDDSH